MSIPEQPTRPYRPVQPANGWLILILLIVFAVFVFRMSDGIGLFGSAEPRPITPRGDLAADEQTQIELFRETSPSVVHVRSLALRRDRFDLNALRFQEGTGSGFIWDSQGHIVTNFHVIQSGQRWQVTLADNSTYPATLIGIAERKDLAVLKIDAPRNVLKPIMVGTSHDLQVGQKVFAIGSPFRLDQTLTTGVVSGLGREINSPALTQDAQPIPILDVIQTDAAINPGNSGGPLLDSSGRLIGVNAAIYNPTGNSSAGIGFAIPVDTVNRIIPDLIAYGKVHRAGLGIVPYTDAEFAFFARQGAVSQQGVLVKYVAPGSSAEQAGILPIRMDESGENLLLGDLIVAVGDHTVQNTLDLYRALDRYEIGDVVPVKLHRGGKTVEVNVTLQEL